MPVGEKAVTALNGRMQINVVNNLRFEVDGGCNFVIVLRWVFQ